MNYLGDFAEDSTVYLQLTTNDREGAAVAPSSAFEADDVRIYKNNGATQKATTNGITMTSPFDSVVGLHVLTIDTSNDTGDLGFWATGSDYICVLVPDETVDGKTVVSILGSFSIENRNNSVVVATNNDKTGYRLSATGVDDVLDEAVEGSRTLRQILRGYSSALLGKISGGGSSTETFRDIDDSKDRITATVDSDGNRTAITLDLT